MARRLVLTWGCAFGCLGCQALTGDFEVGEEVDSGEPPRPYDGLFDGLGASCTECVQSKCGVEADECFHADECRETAECGLSNQPDAADCLLLPGAGALFLAQVCVGLECKHECTSDGDPWYCVDDYDLRPVAMGQRAKMELLFNDPLAGDAPWEGLSVRACDETDVPCDSPLATGVLDQNGTATLDILVPSGAPLTPLPGFLGYIEIGGEQDWFRTSKRYWPWPVRRDVPIAATFPNLLDLPAIIFPTDTAAVIVERIPCSVFVGSVNATFELDTVDGPREPVYLGEFLTLDPMLTEGVIATFIDVPPGEVEIRMYPVGSREVVGRRKILVGAGDVPLVLVPPLPRGRPVY